MSVRTKFKGSVVNVSAIQAEYAPGGDVWADAGKTGDRARAFAIAGAPVRTGDLKARHRRPYRATAYHRTYVTVSNTASYARYVHEGTTGPIRPNNPTGYLWIRPAPHSWYRPQAQWAKYGYRARRVWVRGQRANPWMARALTLAMRSR